MLNTVVWTPATNKPTVYKVVKSNHILRTKVEWDLSSQDIRKIVSNQVPVKAAQNQKWRKQCSSEQTTVFQA